MNSEMRTRPGPKRKEVRLSEKVVVCLTPIALMRVTRAAILQGKSISEFCRDSASDRAEKVLAGAAAGDSKRAGRN